MRWQIAAAAVILASGVAMAARLEVFHLAWVNLSLVVVLVIAALAGIVSRSRRSAADVRQFWPASVQIRVVLALGVSDLMVAKSEIVDRRSLSRSLSCLEASRRLASESCQLRGDDCSAVRLMDARALQRFAGLIDIGLPPDRAFEPPTLPAASLRARSGSQKSLLNGRTSSLPLDAYGKGRRSASRTSRKRHFRSQGSIKIQTERPHPNVILLTKHSDADVGSPRRRFIHDARVQVELRVGHRSI